MWLHYIVAQYICQIEDMLNEVKFSKFVETGSNISEIDLGGFIRCKFQ